MEVEINYQKLNEAKTLFIEIQKQIVNDHAGETGSRLLKEDALAAALVCFIIESYKIKGIS